MQRLMGELRNNLIIFLLLHRTNFIIWTYLDASYYGFVMVENPLFLRLFGYFAGELLLCNYLNIFPFSFSLISVM